MWAALKMARKTYGAWKALEPSQREALVGEALLVRSLAVELGGSAAERFLDGSSEAADLETRPPSTRRPREVVTSELQQAVQALARGCAAPGMEVVNDSLPRSVRVGGTLARLGARRVVPRIQSRISDGRGEAEAEA